MSAGSDIKYSSHRVKSRFGKVSPSAVNTLDTSFTRCHHVSLVCSGGLIALCTDPPLFAPVSMRRGFASHRCHHVSCRYDFR